MRAQGCRIDKVAITADPSDKIQSEVRGKWKDFVAHDGFEASRKESMVTVGTVGQPGQPR